MPPEIQYAAAPSFQKGLTAAETAELAQLEAKYAQPKVQGLSLDEKNELAQLEAKYGEQPAPASDLKTRLQSGFDERKQQQVGNAAGGLVGKLGQGLTFGFGDEMTAGLFAPTTALGNLIAGKEDASIGGAYDQNLAEQRNNLIAAEQQFPITSTGLEIAGGIGTGVAGAGTKLGGIIARAGAKGLAPNAARASTRLLGRAATGAAVGGAGGATYGFGTGEGDEGRLDNAKDLGVSVAAVGGLYPVAGAGLALAGKGVKTAVTGAKARGAEELAATASNIKAEAGAAYKKMRDAGAVINRDKGVNISSNVRATISDQPLNKRLHGDTLSVLKDFETRASKGDLGLEELDQFRQLFGEVISKNTDVAGKMSPDGRLARKAIAAIDNAVDGFSPTDFKGSGSEAAIFLKQGRAIYAKSRKFEDISRILTKADGDANKIKSGLKRFLDNPKKTRGYSAIEIEALKKAANLTTGEGMTKMLGKFGFDFGTSTTFGNTALPVVGAALGSSSSLGLAAAVPIVGTAARQMQKLLARGKAEDLLQVIEMGGKVPNKALMKLKPSDVNAVVRAQKAAPQRGTTKQDLQKAFEAKKGNK